MSSYIMLSYWDLVFASVFLVLNGVLSIRLQLGLERQLLIAATRMIIQLLMIGLILKAVFAAKSPWLTLALAAVMILIAGHEIWARQQRRLIGYWGFGIGASAMMAAGTIVTIFALVYQIEPKPWWSPQFALPLFGMILGNTMTGVSLGLDTLHTTLHREQRAIEARLLLGHTRFEAVIPFMRQSLRSGFMPIINSMSATGVVALPGMMTGQIISGVDPTEAVKYQLLVMFLIGGATGLGVLAATIASVWRLTDARHRLRLDRLSAETKS